MHDFHEHCVGIYAFMEASLPKDLLFFTSLHYNFLYLHMPCSSVVFLEDEEE